MWIKLLAQGPVVVAMDASVEGFSRYKPKNDEPWMPKNCGRNNHAVTAVGYFIKNKKEYLIVRNSWGVNWGIQGYFIVPAKKSCGILDSAWLPEIQPADTPFSEPICPTFWSECNFSGKSFNSCDGVSNFNSKIGGKVSSFNTNNSSIKLFNFFTQPDCKGQPMWNPGTFECDKEDYAYRNNPIISSSPHVISILPGCFYHFDSPCYSGKKTIICNSIDNLEESNFNFTPGSLYIRTQFIKSIIFFEGVKFTGKGFGIKNIPLTNTDEIAGLNEALLKAKSLVVIVRKINEPVDPDW